MTVIKRLQILSVLLVTLATPPRASAQPVPVSPVTPLDIEVVISRYQGDKKIGSLPYLLSVNAGENRERTSLRMGTSVPVRTMSTPSQDGKPLPATATVQYRDVGTNIDANARPVADGRFSVYLSVQDSSVVENAKDATTAGAPVIRNFVSSNTLILRDGQTRQFTAAADRITGEVVRVEVTLKVVK